MDYTGTIDDFFEWGNKAIDLKERIERKPVQTTSPGTVPQSKPTISPVVLGLGVVLVGLVIFKALKA